VASIRSLRQPLTCSRSYCEPPRNGVHACPNKGTGVWLPVIPADNIRHTQGPTAATSSDNADPDPNNSSASDDFNSDCINNIGRDEDEYDVFLGHRDLRLCRCQLFRQLRVPSVERKFWNMEAKLRDANLAAVFELSRRALENEGLTW
jgi:hypothetical protein